MTISCPSTVPNASKAVDVVNIVATRLSATSVRINWDIIDNDNGGVPITGDGFIEHGSTTALGTQKLPGETSRDTYSSHAQTLTGLTSGAEWFFAITSTVQDGRTCTTPVQTIPASTAKTFPPSVVGASPPEYQGVTAPVGQGTSAVDGAQGTTVTAMRSGVQHAYSERPALNADSTRYMDQSGIVYTYPGLAQITTLQTAPGGFSTEVVWHSTNPDVVLGASGGLFRTFNVSTLTGTTSTIPCAGIGPFEPAGSLNNRIVCNSALSGGDLRMVDYSNLTAPTVLGTIAAPGGLDNVAVSLNGNYAVADIGGTCIVYNASMVQQRTLPLGGHGTTANDISGNEVFCVVDGAGGIRVYVLSDNSGSSDYTLPFTNINGASHFSGHATDRPGYLYGSFNTDFTNADGDNTSGFVGAVKIQAGVTEYETWASNYFVNHDYTNQAQATVNKAGDIIIFTSPINGTASDFSVTCN